MNTVNTSHPDCPVRIMYAAPESSMSLHSNELADRPRFAGRWPQARPIAVIKCTEYSDDSGSTVERSNYQVILADDVGDQLIEIAGSHGYQALAFDATLGPVPESEDLVEMLARVEQYPVIDDDHHSALESELEGEAWESYGAREFRAQLSAVLHIVDGNQHEHEVSEDDLSEADLLALWVEGCDAFNINGGSGCSHESGGTVHFYLSEWVDGATRKSKSEVHQDLRDLAVRTRTT